MRYVFILSLAVLLSCQATPQADLLQFVDPMIGTDAADTESAKRHGSGTESYAQTYPAVGPPFAMTYFTPETRPTERKCVSPYYYSDSLLTGFRGSHWTSGSCVQEYGSFSLMPISGDLVVHPEDRASGFRHDRETAAPHEYAVHMDRYDIDVRFTATTRAGLFEIVFPAGKPASVVINPNNEHQEGFVRILPERNEIVGYNPVRRIYQGWGEPAGFSGYFVARFDEPFGFYGVFENDAIRPEQTSTDPAVTVGGYARFDQTLDTLRVKIGASFTSIDQARENLDAEIPDWNYNRVKSQTAAAWNDMLNRLPLEHDSDAELTKYYTAMYHCFLAPHTFSDVDGTYVGFADDSTLHVAEDFVYYTDFSMWDIYRAQLPLVNLIAPEVSRDFVRSLVAMAEQGGWLPIFPMWNHYTAAMIGDHVTAFICEAYMRGIRDFDVDTAYHYMRKNAFETPENYDDYVDGKGRRALQTYIEHGYIPMEEPVNEAFHKNEQVSRTLEYAYDDYCLALMANALGHEADYQKLMQRAENWRNVYDPSVGWVRGRHADGSWAKEFDDDGKMIYITEGTPRHYTWYAPHDVGGLVDAMGGEAEFERKLDEMFEEGYYWHGNEPGHQIPFLYAKINKPEKTRRVVRTIMQTEYGLGPGGLSGNDDAGQMSAWYVLAAQGLYPICPVQPQMTVFGSPLQ